MTTQGRFSNKDYITGGDMTGDVWGPWMFAAADALITVVASNASTGTPVGDLKFQVSPTAELPSDDPGDDVDLDGGSILAINGAGSLAKTFRGAGRVFRVGYDRTSGGTANTSLQVDLDIRKV